MGIVGDYSDVNDIIVSESISYEIYKDIDKEINKSSGNKYSSSGVIDLNISNEINKDIDKVINKSIGNNVSSSSNEINKDIYIEINWSIGNKVNVRSVFDLNISNVCFYKSGNVVKRVFERSVFFSFVVFKYLCFSGGVFKLKIRFVFKVFFDVRSKFYFI